MPPVPEGYKSKKAPTSNPFVDDLKAGHYEQGQWLTRDDIEKCVVEFNPSLTKEQLLTCGIASLHPGVGEDRARTHDSAPWPTRAHSLLNG